MREKEKKIKNKKVSRRQPCSKLVRYFKLDMIQILVTLRLNIIQSSRLTSSVILNEIRLAKEQNVNLLGYYITHNPISPGSHSKLSRISKLKPNQD
ncbi:hypothetical protein RCL_jg4243.t1 [Rhizophagus clarus]|uniref:Uncharacterized protein n=1 Tax=Rhizophagus clarus TaxID=94130 RepID=A0A8H3KTH1_9GLOM|nr:hypothetical protein RCL_jg4243.t1 [Rhizophagus clarus]